MAANIAEAIKRADPNCDRCGGTGLLGVPENLTDTSIIVVCRCSVEEGIARDRTKEVQQRVAELFEREQVTDWDLF